MIGGVLLLALALGSAANAGPGWFLVILWADTWLIAYPHVASMWMRILVDRAHAGRQWFLWTGLPPLVLLGTASLAAFGGLSALNTLYYHWQSWHYTRQSYGIARAYQRAEGAVARDWLTDAVVFVFPIWGWLHRCAQHGARAGSTNFFGGPLWLPAVPEFVSNAAGLFAVVLFVAWTVRARWDRSGHAWFVLSHVAITFVSYIAVTEITRGWIFVNIWHNAQYSFFVWARNAASPADAAAGVARGSLAWLCQPRNWVAYAAVCLAASTIGYVVLNLTVDGFAAVGIAAALVLHQSVNFHHYLIDAVIWRRGRRVLSR
ncbi:MAG: hypothetical protein V4850_29590 [Myxococcota bacterium]